MSLSYPFFFKTIGTPNRSKRIGRKPIILLSGLGSILSSMWVALVLWFAQQIPIHLILVEAVFKTVGGGSTVAVAVLYSVLSDIASPADRYANSLGE